jgi:hypothetical protein
MKISSSAAIDIELKPERTFFLLTCTPHYWIDDAGLRTN